MQPLITRSARLGLGLDAGGTHTRWALADAGGQVWAQGDLPPMSGQQLASDGGRLQLMATLRNLAVAVQTALQAGDAAGDAPGDAPCDAAGALAPHLQGLVAGITGFDAQAMPQWQALAAQALGLPAARVRALSDIELCCAAAFAPGRGVVLIAGTGSIAAHVDAQGLLHRVGGRGAVIDDAGSGHWIARQALRHIWRAEDAQPGSGQATRLGRLLAAQLGGSSWAQARQWVYGATRGELGTLALAVAQAAVRAPVQAPVRAPVQAPMQAPMQAAAQGASQAASQAAMADGADPAALHILQRAGQELARLVLALQQRLGPQPVALYGRVWDLHPLVYSSLLQALPPALAVQRVLTPAHHAAARLAAAPAQSSA